MFISIFYINIIYITVFSLFVECPLPDTIYYRTFPQICYRTLAEYKGSGFLGFSMVCASICKNIDSLEKMRLYMIIRLKKCSCSMADGFQAHVELTI